MFLLIFNVLFLLLSVCVNKNEHTVGKIVRNVFAQKMRFHMSLHIYSLLILVYFYKVTEAVKHKLTGRLQHKAPPSSMLIIAVRKLLRVTLYRKKEIKAIRNCNVQFTLEEGFSLRFLLLTEFII